MNDLILITVDAFYFILAISSFICAFGIIRSPYTYPLLLMIYFAFATFNAFHLASLIFIGRVFQWSGGLLGETWFFTLGVGLWSTTALILAVQYILDFIDNRAKQSILQELARSNDS